MTQGGFIRPIGLSTFIRDELSSGDETWAQELYQRYKKATQAIPLARGRGKRKVISYSGFRHYLYVMRRLGLIEYLLDTKGKIDTQEAVDKGGNPAPHLVPKHFFRAVLSKISDPAWNNIWQAYEMLR